ncbi:Retinal homeobox protein Rx2 [Temnothorax longispinosus]|uniref:Retinal homeobox protein Rx2 n=1 Tax=Temnothorax longispinosus TaxID=300112 RepID=A0A4S2KH24_9HYME|nr:Retinal homeobox protein Rx2 [Temnothorax longispinosus]
MMIGGGVATPPGTAKSAAAIDSEMVQVDGIGSGSDEDVPASTGVARPWEPPSPTFSQTRSHLLQVHPPHHHQQHPAAHHHQQLNVPASLIDVLAFFFRRVLLVELSID